MPESIDPKDAEIKQLRHDLSRWADCEAVERRYLENTRLELRKIERAIKDVIQQLPISFKDQG